MGWGGGFRRRPHFLLGQEWYPDLQVGEDALGTKSCSGGGRILTAGLPGAPFLRQLGQSCAPRSSPAVTVPGSCCRRKVNGDGSRHGKAWGAGGCPGSSGCCSVRCLRCSGDAQGFPGDAARDARRRLPAQEVREGAYRDGREMLGMC